MKQTAGNMGVDLLIVDTGDLHDGNGVSDATTPDGTKSMPIFTEIDYDLLTIGACSSTKYPVDYSLKETREPRALRERGCVPNVQRVCA